MKEFSVGPIHEIHIFEDGTFADSHTVPGMSMSFQISGIGSPIIIKEVDEETAKILEKPDRHLYRYDHETGKFVKHKKL